MVNVEINVYSNCSRTGGKFTKIAGNLVVIGVRGVCFEVGDKLASLIWCFFFYLNFDLVKFLALRATLA